MGVMNRKIKIKKKVFSRFKIKILPKMAEGKKQRIQIYVVLHILTCMPVKFHEIWGQ